MCCVFVSCLGFWPNTTKLTSLFNSVRHVGEERKRQGVTVNFEVQWQSVSRSVFPLLPICVLCVSLLSLSLSDERKSDGESVFQFWFISVLVLSVSLGHTQVNTKISSPCFLSFSFSLCQIYDIVTHMGGERKGFWSNGFSAAFRWVLWQQVKRACFSRWKKTSYFDCVRGV